MLQRTSGAAGFVEPCLPSPAKAPPAGPNWLHEIKHDGFRIMARGAPWVFHRLHQSPARLFKPEAGR